MASVNKAILIGNLGRDPELRYTQSGMAVARFSIATNEQWIDKDDKKQEKTEWHKIVAWGKLGEFCGEQLTKGQLVYIEGKIQTRSWEDQDKNKHFVTEINANQIIKLGSRGEKTEDIPIISEGVGTEIEPSTEDDLPF